MKKSKEEIAEAIAMKALELEETASEDTSALVLISEAALAILDSELPKVKKWPDQDQPEERCGDPGCVCGGSCNRPWGFRAAQPKAEDVAKALFNSGSLGLIKWDRPSEVSKLIKALKATGAFND